MILIAKICFRELERIILQFWRKRNRVFICEFARTKGAKFSGANKIGAFSDVLFSVFDKYSYVGEKCFLRSVSIGKFCSISDKVVVVRGRHPIEYASTSPVLYSSCRHIGKSIYENPTYTEYVHADKDGAYSVVIGNDVWIGYGVKIMEGITIGDGAVIASGAVVTQNVPEYSVMGGVPAKLIRKRFPDDVAEALKLSQWWNLNENDLKIISSNIDDPVAWCMKVSDIQKFNSANNGNSNSFEAGA